MNQVYNTHESTVVKAAWLLLRNNAGSDKHLNQGT
jgi:hypothetical protein